MSSATPLSGLPAPAPRAAAAGLGLRGRLLAAVVAAACLAPLVVAAGLTPDPAGHGTHAQLGLPACGWALTSGYPCPTCGMTTAFALAVRGRLGDALLAQPFGLLLALAAAAGFWSALHVAATGSALGRLWARLLTPRAVWALAALAAVSWAYKWITWTG